jgi:hypothetical protein
MENPLRVSGGGNASRCPRSGVGDGDRLMLFRLSYVDAEVDDGT